MDAFGSTQHFSAFPRLSSTDERELPTLAGFGRGLLRAAGKEGGQPDCPPFGSIRQAVRIAERAWFTHDGLPNDLRERYNEL